MIRDTQQRIVEIRNELQAQKVFSGLIYSQVLMPENTHQLSYTGEATWSGSEDAPIARVRFRFTRTDGLVDPPLINFTHTSSFSPTYKQFAEANGFVFSGGDLSFFSTQGIEGYIADIGDGYVDFYVDFKASIKNLLFSRNSVSISTTCQAVSNVYGTLSVERLI